MPAIDLSVLCIPAECDNIKLPIECEIASRWNAYLLCEICRHFASVMLHFASLHYIFSAYLPTHIKFLMEFHRTFFGTTCISFPNILSSGVFRRETASGFYPWGNVVSPPKRVAEGLCGWRHGNSFPMTQSAQSHRQMRSIPRCSKAVFYIFVFDCIHDSATMDNLFPEIFQ